MNKYDIFTLNNNIYFIYATNFILDELGVSFFNEKGEVIGFVPLGTLNFVKRSE